MLKLEQNRKKISNKAAEFLNRYKKRTFYFSREPKRFSFFQSYKKNTSVIENKKIKERKYAQRTFFTRFLKAETLEQTLNNKICVKEASNVKFKIVNISNILKKIKRGFLLNTSGGISFILRNPHEGKTMLCGKSVYLEISKLKLACREDKTLLNKVISKVGPAIELKSVLRVLYEKKRRYSSHLGKGDTKRSIRIYCCQKKSKISAKLEKETVGCSI